MSDRGKNTTPNTIQYWNGTYWQQPMAIPNIYVNATTGSDTNTGLTLGSPLATLTAAFRLKKFSTVRTQINLAGGSYDPSAMQDLNSGEHGYDIVGTDFTELAPAIGIASYDSVNRVITVTPDPGWTVNAFKDAFIQWTSGPTNVIDKARTKTILGNTSNTISITFPPVNTSGVSALSPGNTIRIVAPAASFTEAALPAGIEPAPYVGGSIPGISEGLGSDSEQGGCNKLQNVDFLNPVSSTRRVTTFCGGWIWNGVRFLTPFNHLYQILAQGFLNAGVNYGGSTQTLAGWGVTYLNTGGFRNPELVFSNGQALFLGHGGRFIASGAYVHWGGGAFRDSGNTFPHGTICAVNGAHIWTNSSASTGRFRVKSDAPAHDFVGEAGSEIEIFQPVTHEGAGGLMRVRFNSTGRLTREIVQEGSDANLIAEYFANIRIDGAGATYGVANAGGAVALGRVTRAAGAWAVGDAVCTFANFPKDIANIYRAT